MIRDIADAGPALILFRYELDKIALIQRLFARAD